MSDNTVTWDELKATCAELGHGVFMASVGANGQPHVAWVMPGWADERWWISTFASSQKSRNLHHRQDVALHWPERPDALVFARATARLVDDRAEVAALWEAGVLPYDPSNFFSGPDDPEALFVELRPTRVTINALGPGGRTRRWAPSSLP